MGKVPGVCPESVQWVLLKRNPKYYRKIWVNDHFCRSDKKKSYCLVSVTRQCMQMSLQPGFKNSERPLILFKSVGAHSKNKDKT